MDTLENILQEVARLQHEGQHLEAKQLLRNWLKIYPEDATAAIEYTWLCYDDVTVDEWRKLLASKVLTTSLDSVVRERLASAYHVIGDDDNAIHHYSIAVSLDETNWRAWQGLGILTDTPEKAEQFLQKAFKLAPTEWQVAFNLGSVYARHNKRREAQQILEEALRLAPHQKKSMISRRLHALDVHG